MNAQQTVRLPLAERVFVGRKVFAGDVDTMLELLADDVDVTVHGVRGGADTIHHAAPFLELLADLDAQRPGAGTPVKVAAGHERTDVDGDGDGPRFHQLHLFRHDEIGGVRELIGVPIDPSITNALRPRPVTW
jgi:hypothetical protein